ncbi:MAG: MFS transporter [Pseudonocardiaceae bacterium]
MRRTKIIRRLLSAHGIAGLGDGLWFSTWAIYLTVIQGIPATTMGLAMGIGSALGLIAATPIGALADRWGPREVLALLSALRAVATSTYLWVDGFWTLLAAAGLLIAAQSAGGGVRITLIYKLIEPDTRLKILAQSRVTQHVAYATGAVFGGAVLTIGTPQIFTAAILLTAAALLVAAGTTLLVPRVQAVPLERRHGVTRAVRDLPFLAVMVATAPLTLCWAILSTGLPLWVHQSTVAPTWTSAFAVVVSSIAIAVLQVRVTQYARRAIGAVRAVRWSGLALASSCVLFAGASWTQSSALAFTIITVGVTANFIGELYFVAARWGLSLRLMAKDAEGQYQGLTATTEAAITAVGPAIITVLLAGGGSAGWCALAALVILPITPIAWLVRTALRTRTRPCCGSDTRIRQKGATLVPVVPVRSDLVSRQEACRGRDQARCAARPEADPLGSTGIVAGHHARSAELTPR